MKLNFVLLVLFSCGFWLISCSQNKKKETDPSIPDHTEAKFSSNHLQLDTSKIAVIKFDQSGNWPFDKTYKPASLSRKEIIQIDSLLNSCVQKYNSELTEERKEPYRIDFKKFNYKFQYIPVINNKGEKEVWINGFCDTWGKNWEEGIVFVHDGGNCYFNLKINLSTGICYELMVNGYA